MFLNIYNISDPLQSVTISPQSTSVIRSPRKTNGHNSQRTTYAVKTVFKTM